MNDSDKTKEELIAELETLRSRVFELESTNAIVPGAASGDAIESLREMFQAVIDTIPACIWWKDRDSRFLGCNKKLAINAGLQSPKDLIGKTDYDMPWKKEESDWFVQWDRKIMEENRPQYHIIERKLMADGREAWLDTSKVPLHDAQGNVVGTLGTYEDITQRRESEQELEKAHQELQEAHDALARANEELDARVRERTAQLEVAYDRLKHARDQALQASVAKSNFLANMSHELRTPLNGVVSMSDLMLRGHLSPEVREMTTIIHRSAEALMDIVNDVLDFSKIEAGRMEVEITEFDLLSLVEGTAELVAGKAQQKNISLVTYVDPQIPGILQGDGRRIRQVLLNLLSNAIKFTDEGEVAVRAVSEQTDSRECRVRIEVVDTGIGLAEGASAKLFQPFSQADSSITRKYGGTGLGLSIAKQLVELMNGSIGVDSDFGQGATFWFSVPLERRKESDSAGDAAAVETPELLSEASDLRVLVIGAPPLCSAAIRGYLAAWGIKSESVDDLTQASAVLGANSPFDVLIVERMAQGVDVIAENKCIQALARSYPARMILCSNEKEPELYETADKLGFAAFLSKPFRQSHLIDAIAVPTLTLLAQQNEKNKAAREEERPAPAPAAQTSCEPSKAATVLVVEDNAFNQRVAQIILEKLGLNVKLASCGRDALDAMAQQSFALVLMDCQMPDMDGFEVTEAIRRSEVMTGQHVPIVAMTAQALHGDREKCLASGMDDFLAKPIDISKMEKVLSQWLSREGLPHEPVLGLPGSGRNGANGTAEAVLDVEELRDNVGDEGVVQFLQMFLSTEEELFGKLEVSIAMQDLKKLKASVHELKGCCQSLYAHQMSRLCKEMEETAASGDWHAIRRGMEQMNLALVPLRQSIISIIGDDFIH
jgi:PAS domain S-box-containing protein